MINYNLNDSDLVRGRDIRTIIDEVNANEISGDGLTITVDKNEGGTSIQVIDQFGGGSGGSGFKHPFIMSLSKDAEENQLVTISQGSIIVQDAGGGTIKYSVESNSVNINSFTSGQTVYVYLRLVADWTDGSDFKGYPTLTIKTGIDIDDSNFAANSVQSPITDSGFVFFQIGTVLVETVNTGLKYTTTQISNDNFSLVGFSNTAFSVSRLFKEKTDDSSIDTDYDYYVNSGQATLPEGQSNLPVFTFDSTITESGFIYIEIEGTQNTDTGGWSDFTSVVIQSSSSKSNTNDVNYILIAQYTSGLITQNQIESFQSGGRIY